MIAEQAEVPLAGFSLLWVSIKKTWNDGASGGGWVKAPSDTTGDYAEFTAKVHYPFNPLVAMPSTRYFWNTRNTVMTGISETTDIANRPP